MNDLSMALSGAAVMVLGAMGVRAARRERRRPDPSAPPVRPAPQFDDLLTPEQVERDRYLFYFFTPRCFPCRRVGPRVDRLAAACRNVVKIDVSLAPEAADRFGVTETPTLVVVAEGRIAHFAVGATAGGELLETFAAGEGVDA